VKNILLKRGLVCGIAILFLGLCITSSTGVNVDQKTFPLNKGELAWWKFNEGSGSTAGDSSGHGYDGTVVGATWTSVGLEFDGTNDYVDFDAHSVAIGMNKTDDITVIVRFRSDGGTGMLFSMSHTNPDRAYFDMQIASDGKVGVIMGDVTCTFELLTTGSYNDGDWHVLESEFLGDTTNPTLNLYIDGDLDATTTEWLCPMIDEDFLTVKVGRNSNTEGEYLDGEIDDIKYYKGSGPPGDPPEAPTITGPPGGDTGESLTYTFKAHDPDGDEVQFIIDWGDDSSDNTIYVASDEETTKAHTWSSPKTYTITAYAQDDNGLIGPSSTFEVVIPRSKVVNTHPFLKFIQNYPNMFTILKYVLGL
jgi:hypothetical protein